MSTYETSSESLSLDGNTKPSDRRWAAAGTTVYLILLLIFTFLSFYTQQDPPPEAGGVMASFGNVEIAGSGSAENENQETPNKPSDNKTDEVETNDDIKSESIKDNKDPENPSDNKNNSTTKEDDGPKGLNFGEFNGNGKDQGNGKVGTPDGRDDNLGRIGTGKGDKGDGVDEGKSGRDCKRNCYSCTVGSNWDEVGDAYISIDINADGKVISSKLADVKKYPKNANFYGKQKQIAEECAKQREYASSSATTKNVIVKISFRKG